MSEYDYYLFKVCLFADRDVGKGTLSKILKGVFDGDRLPVLPFKLFLKSVIIHGKKRVILQFWTNTNEKRIPDVWNAYIRGTKGIILMYDITNAKSFNRLSEWIRLIGNSIPVLLVGNKLDLEENRVVSKEQIELFKEEFYISESIEVSLETGDNVENMFRKLTEMMLGTKIEENDFRLELIREPIRESGEEYINPFIEVKELKKELTELTNSINVWGPKIHMGKIFWIIYAICLISIAVDIVILILK